MIALAESAWDAWSPQELSARLGHSNTDWYVAGGWALDLWHGRQTRPHEDLEIVVLAERINHYRKVLPELELFMARSGSLSHLPATAEVPADVWQLWGADMAAGCWRVDIMLERGTPDTWVYKRHAPFRLPGAAAIRKTAEGIRYLAPTIVLLFKAKHRREKDLKDFLAALPHLDPTERADLHGWLEELHPGHAWLTALR